MATWDSVSLVTSGRLEPALEGEEVEGGGVHHTVHHWLRDTVRGINVQHFCSASYAANISPAENRRSWQEEATDAVREW